METGQFELHYQPIVLIDTGEILGSEVLVRWRHPTRGQVMPAEFIALSERTGQIIELGRWVLDRACRQWREWADLGHVSHRLSVNVSAHQLKDAGFADEVGAVLRRHSMPPAALVLELTESVFALDTSVILDQLSLLAASGVHIAVDDFGTGYSSLSYLQRFNVHELKVDKSFVDGLGTDNPDDGALTAAILSMAQSLRLEVVAEGIERVAQRDELWSMGCALGQGYLYSRPVPPTSCSPCWPAPSPSARHWPSRAGPASPDCSYRRRSSLCPASPEPPPGSPSAPDHRTITLRHPPRRSDPPPCRSATRPSAPSRTPSGPTCSD